MDACSARAGPAPRAGPRRAAKGSTSNRGAAAPRAALDQRDLVLASSSRSGTADAGAGWLVAQVGRAQLLERDALVRGVLVHEHESPGACATRRSRAAADELERGEEAAGSPGSGSGSGRRPTARPVRGSRVRTACARAETSSAPAPRSVYPSGSPAPEPAASSGSARAGAARPRQHLVVTPRRSRAPARVRCIVHGIVPRLRPASRSRPGSHRAAPSARAPRRRRPEPALEQAGRPGPPLPALAAPRARPPLRSPAPALARPLRSPAHALAPPRARPPLRCRPGAQPYVARPTLPGFSHGARASVSATASPRPVHRPESETGPRASAGARSRHELRQLHEDHAYGYRPLERAR